MVFDIETEPQPEARLRDICPPLDEQIGEFDPNTVKVQHLKDQLKIDAKVEQARLKHEELVAGVDERQQQNFLKFQEAAPLSASYGKVLAIGLYSPTKDRCVIEYGDGIAAINEASMLARFWSRAADLIMDNRFLVGVNILEFDLPFMLRRSWILGVSIPSCLVSGLISKWPKWHENFIDLRGVWLNSGSTGSTKSSFESLAHAFGTEGKTEKEGGKYFWKIWREDRERAIKYLKQDVRQPAKWAIRMGLFESEKG